MKKTLIAVTVAFVLAGAAFAQPWNQPNRALGQTYPVYGRGYGIQAPAVALEKISLEGSLELVDSRIAIKNDGKTYFVMIPSRLYGFIPGLVEGAKVKLEGYSHEIVGLKNTFGVKVDSLSINGKSYDLTKSFVVGRGITQNPMGGMRGGNFGPSGAFGRGRW